MLNLKENSFAKEVLNTTGLVLVDFWAPWCGPCRMLEPILEQIADEYKSSVKVVKINVDENNDLASQYGIMSIPTIMIFKDGKVVEQFVGVLPKQQIETKLQKYT